eukprot:CAMPEP_0180547494 /NCGR_PEP_ID=MMETSP1036_2-20121128/71123_1 /TAXON_ID=632150 /ORGANISM="Azadinium spinosum, Strain 3D9" /LENGTH=58 /DNA_ID=CAMNT_0022562647 /DNA_START=73 /DNA_END=246 /DNA_ORIENTATION=-
MPTPATNSAKFKSLSIITRRRGAACDTAHSMLAQVRKFSAPRQKVLNAPPMSSWSPSW